jgi:hypothetical protein
MNADIDRAIGPSRSIRLERVPFIPVERDAAKRRTRSALPKRQIHATSVRASDGSPHVS